MLKFVKIQLMRVRVLLGLLFLTTKANIGLLIYRFQAFGKGYKFVTAAKFFEEFKPSKSCKACRYGQGYYVIQDPKTKAKRIELCDCTMRQYRRSGKKYIVRGIE